MIPTRLLRQPLTIQRMTPLPDGYGSPVLQPDGDPVPVNGYLHYTSSSEVLNDRDTVTTGWTVFVPAGTALSAYDQISFDGALFQVTGQPQSVWNPRRGLVSHIEARLTEVI